MPDHKARIAALLAKAEDPGSTEEEKQALLAKAMFLMQKHDIKEHVARASRGESQEVPIADMFMVSGAGGHGVARALALGIVAEAMGAMASYLGGTRTSAVALTVVAHPSTLNHLHIITDAMQPSMERLGSEACRGMQGYKRCVAFRSYLKGFGAGVAMHFQKVEDEPEPDDVPRDRAALILHDRSQVVLDTFNTIFPDVKKGRATLTDAEMFYRGRAAGFAHAAPNLQETPPPRGIE